MYMHSIATKDVKLLLDTKVIKRLNLIIALKYFGLDKCLLDIEEQIKIISMILTKGLVKIISKNDKIYIVYEYKIKFHILEYIITTKSTNKRVSKKKKQSNSINIVLEKD